MKRTNRPGTRGETEAASMDREQRIAQHAARVSIAAPPARVTRTGAATAATFGSRGVARTYPHGYLPPTSNLRPSCKRGQLLALLLTEGVTQREVCDRDGKYHSRFWDYDRSGAVIDDSGWNTRDLDDALRLLASVDGVPTTLVGDRVFVAEYAPAATATPPAAPATISNRERKAARKAAAKAAQAHVVEVLAPHSAAAIAEAKEALRDSAPPTPDERVEAYLAGDTGVAVNVTPDTVAT